MSAAALPPPPLPDIAKFFPRDAKYVKVLVYSVFILDLTSTVMCVADAYHWFASGFENIAALNDTFLSGFDTPMIGGFLAAIVQCFYCYRLWTLSKYTLPICILIIMIIAIAQVVAGIYGAVIAHIAGTFSVASSKGLPAAYMVYVGAAAADILIAVTMTILLTRSRKKAHVKTDFIIRRIINLTVETNLLSSTLAVLVVILLVGVPGTNYFTAPGIIVGKVYSNSLLLLLNNRKFISDNVSSTTDSNSTGRALRMSKFRA
ncbi:hypothetical protein GGX14DRAFT_620512 [Mycena pura]|uniref:DUF6534 domain-containing protein n=1 Tax=Mycena pura TaxID=153505 RepID=A0AAD6UJB5_9AGAR|nr:hypothetical protein GGX14DRAFT_620512 [Mycena pura]